MSNGCEFGRETREMHGALSRQLTEAETRITAAIHRQDIDDAKKSARREERKTLGLYLSILLALIGLVTWVRADTTPHAQAHPPEAQVSHAPDATP